MSDALSRLFRAVMAAKDLDPERSRTARLFRRGQPKMAKKLAEEAIEVAIDAVSGNSEAVIRESADLLYNLMVVWVAAGVRPEDVWTEMERREKMLGIAEKLPKASGKLVTKPVAKPFGSRRKVAAQAQARSGRSRMAADGRGRKRRHR